MTRSKHKYYNFVRGFGVPETELTLVSISIRTFGIFSEQPVESRNAYPNTSGASSRIEGENAHHFGRPGEFHEL